MINKTKQNEEYDLTSAKLPYLSGFLLRVVTWLLESPLRGLLIPSLFRNAGISWLRKQEFEETPTLLPIHYTGSLTDEEVQIPQKDWLTSRTEQNSGFKFSSILDYATAYREGKITPEDIANKVLESIEASESTDPPLGAFIAINREDVMKQAKKATERFKNGKTLSVFDGVPVTVKDELDMIPYPSTVGTSFLGTNPVTEDATVVARMRAAGALLIGKANMHEIGIGVTGLNPHYGTARNPYNPNHYPGGSSSGPAVAVAAGFCPVSLGADGGGSIRTPSSFCGLVGLKSTFGRVSEFGAAPLCWSVAHVGPLTASATDAALAYAVIAGSDPNDPLSLHQPIPKLDGWDNIDLSDLTLGVYWPWFRHATDGIVFGCEVMLQNFENMGAKIQEVSIPDLEANRVAHTIVIASEMAQSQNSFYANHHRDYSFEVRINLALARELTARDYILAQRVRTRIIENFNNALKNVDIIVTPTNGLTAPIIPKTAFPNGDSDLSTLVEIMRFVTPANLTGLPAISFPVGYNEACLPIGMQAIGKAWQEQTLLRLAFAAEQVVEKKVPQIFYNILPD